MTDFVDRVVMITGASGNLGSATGRAFLEAGAKLALIERRKELLIEEFPELVDESACYMSRDADLTVPDDVSQAVSDIVDYFGRIDVLVNTVGGYQAGNPLHETSMDTWEAMIQLNARVAFITTRCVVPHMLRNNYGKIVHIAARPGLKGSANASAYSAGKAAVIRLVESASAELRDQGINVNCIVPGTIDTPENRAEMPDADHSLWVQPASLASVIKFLASDDSRDIHGAAIPVYGLT